MWISNINFLLILMFVGCKGNRYCVNKEIERICFNMNMYWFNMLINLIKY